MGADPHYQWGNSPSRHSFFNAVRDNAVGGHKAAHVNSLQIVQNFFSKISILLRIDRYLQNVKIESKNNQKTAGHFRTTR